MKEKLYKYEFKIRNLEIDITLLGEYEIIDYNANPPGPSGNRPRYKISLLNDVDSLKIWITQIDFKTELYYIFMYLGRHIIRKTPKVLTFHSLEKLSEKRKEEIIKEIRNTLINKLKNQYEEYEQNIKKAKQRVNYLEAQMLKIKNLKIENFFKE